MTSTMLTLRLALCLLGISFEDNSSVYVDPELNIYRTKFEYGGYNWSVISGHGTYGGNTGLLEVMSNAINGGEPVGFLEPADVFAEMYKCKKFDIEEFAEKVNVTWSLI